MKRNGNCTSNKSNSWYLQENLVICHQSIKSYLIYTIFRLVGWVKQFLVTSKYTPLTWFASWSPVFLFCFHFRTAFESEWDSETENSLGTSNFVRTNLWIHSGFQMFSSYLNVFLKFTTSKKVSSEGCRRCRRRQFPLAGCHSPTDFQWQNLAKQSSLTLYLKVKKRS